MTIQAKEHRLQGLIDQEIRKKHTYSLTLGVRTADGSFSFAGAAGHADADGTRPMTPQTPFYLASITKMYTAAVIMALVERGMIDLTAPIAGYLPAELTEGIHIYNGVDYTSAIRVQHLISHTSGLADYFEDKPKGGQSFAEKLQTGHDATYTVQDYLNIARALPPHFAPGTPRRARYSDTNFQLLGAIIEAVSGQPLAASFEEYIFQPLGLKETYPFDHTLAASRPAPAPIYYEDQVVHIPRVMSSFGPDGGMVSTLDEVLRFLQGFFEARLFDANLLARMQADWHAIFFPMQYGQGLMRFKLPRIMSPFAAPPELIGHSGSSGAFAFYNPARRVYLAGTFNQFAAPSRPFGFMMKALNAVK